MSSFPMGAAGGGRCNPGCLGIYARVTDRRHTPIISDPSGSAVVPTASVGVPPAESSFRSRPILWLSRQIRRAPWRGRRLAFPSAGVMGEQMKRLQNDHARIEVRQCGRGHFSNAVARVQKKSADCGNAPIISDLSGSAVVPTASVGVPPAESSIRSRPTFWASRQARR